MPNAQLSPIFVRDKIIQPGLMALEPYVPSCAQAMELLLGTAATESHLGYWLRQEGGPALGIYQMEPATEWDIWNNYLAFRPELRRAVQRISTGRKEELVTNHAYATVMARLQYRRAPKPLPEAGDLEGQAKYYKQYYNTPLGKGSVEKYLADWKRLVEGKL